MRGLTQVEMDKASTQLLGNKLNTGQRSAAAAVNGTVLFLILKAYPIISRYRFSSSLHVIHYIVNCVIINNNKIVEYTHREESTVAFVMIVDDMIMRKETDLHFTLSRPPPTLFTVAPKSVHGIFCLPSKAAITPNTCPRVII